MRKFLVAGALLLASFSVAQAGIVATNINGDALTNCEISPSCNDPYPRGFSFTLTQDTFIHTVEGFFQTTNGLGNDVALVDLGLTNLSDFTTVSATAVNDPLGYFFGFHQVTTLDQLFLAGNYEVYLSSVSQWGYNSTSNNAGLAVVTSLDAPDAPEPGTWALIGAGLLGLGYRARARRKL